MISIRRRPWSRPARVRRARTVALSLLVVAGCVNYLDRSAVAIANGPIRDALGLSRGEMGVLLSAFSLAYGFAQASGGRDADEDHNRTHQRKFAERHDPAEREARGKQAGSHLRV